MGYVDPSNKWYSAYWDWLELSRVLPHITNEEKRGDYLEAMLGITYLYLESKGNCPQFFLAVRSLIEDMHDFLTGLEDGDPFIEHVAAPIPTTIAFPTIHVFKDW